MEGVNPYRAPSQLDDRDRYVSHASGLRIGEAFAIITLTSVAFAAGGTLVGCLLGALVPEYYRTVFDERGDPTFSPVQVGVGLGFTQGLVAGLVIGCVVVLAVSIANRRRGMSLVDGNRSSHK